jgi:pyruvate dehydrogenase E2 component (dihydrolipoamide acetyltransferase)
MANLMTMPKLGLTMVEGKIGKWLKEEGDFIHLDEPLLDVETEKIANRVNATFEGVLLKILVEAGEKQVVKGGICIIGEAGEDISSLIGSAVPNEKEVSVLEVKGEIKSAKLSSETLASPIAKRLAREKGLRLDEIIGTGPGGRIVEKDVLAEKVEPKSSPTAKKIAQSMGVDLIGIEKSGRIMKTDVITSARSHGFEGVETTEEMSTMRNVIAERMTSSWLTSPAVTYDMKIDATQLKVFKEQISLQFKVTYTDLIALMVSRVLMDHPQLNCTIDENQLIKRNFVNLGVAVALDEGLVVPVIRFANNMNLKALSRSIKDMSYKAKNFMLESEDLQGGTFTITNLGMYQVDSFSPIINQPEVAILGITAIKDTLVPVSGEIAIRPMMNLCLTADHRAVDGAVAAQFLAQLKEALENPALMLL